MGSVQTCASGALRTVLRVQRLRCWKSWVWRKGWKQRWPSRPIVDESMLNNLKHSEFDLVHANALDSLEMQRTCSFQELRWHIALLGRCQKRFCRLPPLQRRLSGTQGTLERNNSRVAKTLTARSKAHGVETQFPDGSRTVPTMHAGAEFPPVAPTQERSAVDQAKCL